MFLFLLVTWCWHNIEGNKWAIKWLWLKVIHYKFIIIIKVFFNKINKILKTTKSPQWLFHITTIQLQQCSNIVTRVKYLPNIDLVYTIWKCVQSINWQGTGRISFQFCNNWCHFAMNFGIISDWTFSFKLSLFTLRILIFIYSVI